MSLELFQHQGEGVDFLLNKGRGCLFYEQGLGKTVTALTVMDKDRGFTVVVCPRSIMKGTWLEDSRHFPDLDVNIYHGSNRDKRNTFFHYKMMSEEQRRCGVLVTTFETFRLHRDEIMRLEPYRIVVDESSRMKNRNSETAKAIISCTDQVEKVILMTGTPAPNGPEEYFTQVRCVYGVSCPSFWTWSGKFMTKIMKTVPGRRMPVVDRFVLKDPAEFARRIERMAHVKKKIDCFKDMPEKLERVVSVELSAREKGVYRSIEEEFYASLNENGDGFDIDPTAVTMKLRQVCGGNIRDTENEVWKRVGKSKLDALQEIIDGFDPGRPFLVWTQFREEATRVSEMLADQIDHRICDGRNSDDIPWFLEEFRKGDVRCLICHPQSVGHGATLVRCGDRFCSDAIYYSMSYSYELQVQSMDRIHRIGQMEPCTYWYIVAEDTIDEAIRKAIASKERISERVMTELRAIAFERNGLAQARKD